MATTTLVSTALQSEGVREFGPITIPDGLSRATIAIDHGGVDMPGVCWGVMGSLDGGTTWMPWGSAGTGGPQSGSASRLTIALPTGQGRKAKAFLWVSSAVTFGVTLIVE
jgi:hypothetical protein